MFSGISPCRSPILVPGIMAAAEDSFNPLVEASVQAWYDGADLTKMTHNLNRVSQMDDKSGNGNHATQASGSLQPLINQETINGRNVFSPGNLEYMDTPIVPDSGNSTIFCVFKTPATFESFDAPYGVHDAANHRYYAELKSDGGMQLGIGTV